MITAAGYLTVAGSVITAVSQVAVQKEEEEGDEDDDPSDYVDTE